MSDTAPESADRPDPVDRPEGLGVFDETNHDTATEAPRSRRLGLVTLVLAVVLLVLDGIAIALLSANATTAAAGIALVTTLASIVVGVLALLAVALRRGRVFGVVAVLLAVLSNPFVLVYLIGRLNLVVPLF